MSRSGNPAGRLQIGAAYYPEHLPEERWPRDLDLMRAAGLNAVRVADFAWPWLEPAVGEYTFGWLDRLLALLAERDMTVLLCAPLRSSPPHWLIESAPGLFIETEDGVKLGYGSRYTYCINHPVLRQRGVALAEAMARHFGSHPAISGWHLDNEYGDEPDCHCPACVAAWRQWLNRCYGTVDALNKAWGTDFWAHTYSRWDQVPTPRRSKVAHNPGMMQAWRQFRSDCTADLIGQQADALRRHSRHPVTTNFQALWNPRTDYAVASRHLDLCGTNYYPPFGKDYRDRSLALSALRCYREAPPQLHELRSAMHVIPGRGASTPWPGEVARLMMHCLANGANDMFFFRWDMCPFGLEHPHGALVDYRGNPTRTYTEVAAMLKRLHVLAPRLLGTRVKTPVAMLYDFPARWMWEEPSPWNGPASLYMDLLKLCHAGIRAEGIEVDAISSQHDLNGYRILIIPLSMVLSDDLVARLRSFVADGGQLLVTPFCGVRDADARVFPGRLHPDLEGLLGLTLADGASCPLGAVSSPAPTNVDCPDLEAEDDVVPQGDWDGESFKGQAWADVVAVSSATVLSRFSHGWYAGNPMVTRNAVGKGQVWYVATFPDAGLLRRLYARMAAAAGVAPVMPGVPETVELSSRVAPDGTRYIFLLNSLGSPVDVPVQGVFHDLWRDREYQGTLTLAPRGFALGVHRSD